MALNHWLLSNPLPVLIVGGGGGGGGLVQIDQTTPGNTNGVVVNSGTLSAGGFTALIQATPAVQAAAYAAGQNVGNLITLTGSSRIAAGSGLLQAITAAFASGVVPVLDVILFSANPTASNTADRTAVAIAAADNAKVLGVVHMNDATLLGVAAPSLVQGQQQAMPFKLAAGTALFASVVTRSAITLTSTTDMVLSAFVLQD